MSPIPKAPYKKSYKRKYEAKGPPKNPKKFSLSRSEVRAKSEIKELVAYTSGAIPVGGFVNHMCAISQGAEIYNRVGRIVQLVGLQVKYLAIGPSASIQNEFLRLLFFWDQSPNGTVPAISDVIDTTVGGGVTAFKNTAKQADRFTFLRDIIVPLQNVNNATPSAADAHAHGEIYVSLRDFPQTQWAGSASGCPQQGALMYMLQSWKNTGATTTSGELIMQTKVTYTDS